MSNLANALSVGPILGHEWTDLAPALHNHIAEFYRCQNDGSVRTVVEEILKNVFRGGFILSYGEEGASITWDMVLQYMQRSGAPSKGKPAPSSKVFRGLLNMIDDPHDTLVDGIHTESENVKLMFKEIGEEAFKYYHMFGMCPVGIKRVRSDEDVIEEGEEDEEHAVSYELYVPDPLEGNFVYRRENKVDVAFAWKWKSSGYGMSTAGITDTGPDRSVKIIVWPGRKPSVRCMQPFQSTVNDLRKDYPYRSMAFDTHTAIMLRQARPIVTVQTDRHIVNTEDLPPAEQWNDHLNGGDPEESLTHLSNQRLERSFRERFEQTMGMMAEDHASVSYPLVDRTTGMAYRGNPTASADFLVLPAGTRAGNVPFPTPFGSTIQFEDWWRNKVAAMFRVPPDIYSGNQGSQRTVRATEQISRLMEETTIHARQIIAHFWETAWVKLFSKLERSVISQRAANLDEQEGRERAAVIAHLRYMVNVTPKDPSLPTGLNAENIDLLAPASEEGVVGNILETEEEEAEDDTLPLGRLQRMIFQDIERTTKIDTIVNVVIGEAHARGLPLREDNVRKEATDLVYAWESGKVIHMYQRNRYNTIGTSGRPLRVHFIEPTRLSIAEIMAAEQQHWITHEVGASLFKKLSGLPADTPTGIDPIQLDRQQLLLKQRTSRTEGKRKEVPVSNKEHGEELEVKVKEPQTKKTKKGKEPLTAK